jgi:hypothetical protein
VAKRSNETSRQRRARENRARRAALEARRKAAQTPAEERAARRSQAVEKSRPERDARAPAGRRQPQGRLGQEPVDVASLEGSFLGKVVQVPGGMQVVMATVLVVVLTLMAVFMDTVPPEGAERGAEPTRTLIEAYGPSAALFLAPPVILVGNALLFSLHERRRRMWMISAVMLVIFSALMVQFIFPAAFLFYAAWRSKRIEDGPAARPGGGKGGGKGDDDAPSDDGSDADDE